MANNTFPREARILTSEQFDKVFKNNTVRARAPGIVLLAIRNDVECSRLGLVVPKKVLKRAVWRNNVKRVVRETFRVSRGCLPNIDLVFIAKPKIGELSNIELSCTLKRLWHKISRQLDNQQF